MSSQELTIGIAHALLGDQKDCCAKNKDRTNNVEDCCTDATSGWKLDTFRVFNSYNICFISIRNYYAFSFI